VKGAKCAALRPRASRQVSETVAPLNIAENAIYRAFNQMTSAIEIVKGMIMRFVETHPF
jgi:hypothetical protein